MTSNGENRRSLIIGCVDGSDLHDLLGHIPGYRLLPFEDSSGRPIPVVGGERRFQLMSDEGEVIVVRHRDGEPNADTVNVLDQDHSDVPVPLHADELVKLHHAIGSVDGLYSQVVAADIDLLPPSP